MQRRTVLRAVALASTSVLAGCATERSVGGDRTSVVATGEPTLEERSFRVIESGCGTQTNEATVEFQDTSVVVSGTITGSDACQTAELAAVNFDADTGALTVTVATLDREEGGVCAQCLTEIDYRATITFSGGLPSVVTVNHDGTGGSGTVATVDRLAETTTGT